MDFEVGTIHTGKITGITNFGAFVTIAPGKSGLVHISEVAGSYVNNVRDFLTEGQEVVVKIIGVDKTGRLNLSIKAAAQAPADPPRRRAPPDPPPAPSEPSFEDKLKRFMQDSNSKISGIKRHPDKKNSRRRGK